MEELKKNQIEQNATKLKRTIPTELATIYPRLSCTYLPSSHRLEIPIGLGLAYIEVEIGLNPQLTDKDNQTCIIPIFKIQRRLPFRRIGKLHADFYFGVQENSTNVPILTFYK